MANDENAVFMADGMSVNDDDSSTTSTNATSNTQLNKAPAAAAGVGHVGGAKEHQQQQQQQGKSYGALKCLCNDPHMCPKNYRLSRLSAEDTKYIQSLQEAYANRSVQHNPTQLPELNFDDLRFCTTESVCITKRLKMKNGSTYLKFICDHSLNSSLRNGIIEFRDCKLNTASETDRELVLKKNEHCCDESNFCNALLNPTKFATDLSDFRNPASERPPPAVTPITSNPAAAVGAGGGANRSLNSSYNAIYNPVNIVLMSCLLLVIFFTTVLIMVILVKKYNGRKSRRNYSSPSTSSQISMNPSHKNYPFEPLQSPDSDMRVAKMLLEPLSNSKNPSLTTHDEAALSKTTQTTTGGSDSNPSTTSSPTLSLSTGNQTKAGGGGNSINPSTWLFGPASHHQNDVSEPLLGHGHHHPHHLLLHHHQSPTESHNIEQSTDMMMSMLGPGKIRDELSTGSGAGNPQCVPLTIARQIKLIYPSIGNGRFGEVYKGEWRAGYVAVKTFNSADEKSWENEYNIYMTNGFRNDNILGFITADNIDRGTYTELWLITEYHENGSLYDFLNLHTITPDLALKMCMCIVNGLDHIHMPINSVKGKPALAHCDLKSKNILVKSDLTCCISDFGLALSGDNQFRVIHTGGAIRTGTKRYMAPEILAKTINMSSLLAFQKAEMYSLALIIWELLTRCQFTLNSQTYSYDYMLPYQEFVGMDPEEATMKMVVCDQKKRPAINELWKQVPIISHMCGLTEELWVENPSQRLSTLRVKKALLDIKPSPSMTSSPPTSPLSPSSPPSSS